MRAAITRVQFVAVGPRGEIERYAIKVNFKDYEAYRKDIIASLRFKKNAFSAGANFSYIKYTDTRISDVSEIALTVKGGYTRRFSPRWDTGISFYMTALPLTSSGGTATVSSARFLGINFRIGYKLNKKRSPWSWYLLAGYYYTTMMVSNDAFGFRNMQGPQLFPVVRKQNSNGSSITSYLKFSPVSQRFSLRQVSDNEIAIGFAYGLKPKKNKSVAFTLDVARLQLSIAEPTQSADITSTSISLGAAYNF